jgi:hypothetical protein
MYFFLFQRRDNGVNNDVFVGKTKLSGIDTIIEWYFLSFLWQNPDETHAKNGYQTPIQARFYLTIPNIKGPQVKYNHFFNFKIVKLNLNDFDISTCVGNRHKRHFMFSLGSIIRLHPLYNIG